MIKKFASIILIVTGCMAIMTGCGNDNKKDSKNLIDQYKQYGKYLPVLGAMLNHIIPVPPPPYVGPAYVTATDGEYTDKIGIDWDLVDNSVSYRVYRSYNMQGPFTESERVGTVDAADISAITSTSNTQNADSNTSSISPLIAGNTSGYVAESGTCTNPIMQASYQSNVDLNETKMIMGHMNGRYVLAGETFRISIKIGSSFTAQVAFPGGLWGHQYMPDEVLSIFNTAVGNKAVCSLVYSGDYTYIKIVSSEKIVFENILEIYHTAFWRAIYPSPLKFFLDENAGWDTVITADPVQISCNDTTPPTVVSTSPANNATNVAVNTSISVVFSETIDPASFNTGSLIITGGGTSVAGTISGNGTFTPSASLSYNTLYTATITTFVKDLAGNNMAANYTWAFTTVASSTTPTKDYYFTDANATPGMHYYYAVAAVDAEGNVSTLSPADDGFAKVSENVPGKVTNCSATDGTYTTEVTVTWTAASRATYYNVYRTNGTTVFIVGDNITGTSFNDTTVPPGLFSYKIAPYNASGEGVSSDPDTGFRGLTNQEFFDEAYKNENAALSRLQLLQQTGTNMLGSETIYDKDGDGTCVYKATADIISMKGHATITFTNFCDLYLTLNGAQVVDADMSMNGTITGQLNISGIYTGYIRFDVIVAGGYATGGNYYVSQNGGAETTLPGDYVQPLH